MLSALAIATEPLAAEKIVKVGPLLITNSMFFGLITAVFVIGLFIAAAKFSQLWPKSKFAYYFETLTELVIDLISESFGSRKKALKFLPLLLTLFFFILVSNISGLLPGMGSITYSEGGHHISFFRSFTTDLNATLAMAILTIGIVQFSAIRELGILGHLKHYFTNEPWKPVNLFIGINEVFSELLRIVTLSMRLYGVIYAGEVLLFAIGQLAGNLGWAAMVPILFLELFFSVVQAYLFMMLSATYLAIATAHPEEDKRKSKKPAPGAAAATA